MWKKQILLTFAFLVAEDHCYFILKNAVLHQYLHDSFDGSQGVNKHLERAFLKIMNTLKLLLSWK